MVGMIAIDRNGSGRYFSTDGEIGEINSTDCKPGLFFSPNIEESWCNIFVDKSLILSLSTMLRDVRKSEKVVFVPNQVLGEQSSHSFIVSMNLSEKEPKCMVCDMWLKEFIDSLDIEGCSVKFYLDGNEELFCVIEKPLSYQIYWVIKDSIYSVEISGRWMPFIKHIFAECSEAVF